MKRMLCTSVLIAGVISAIGMVNVAVAGERPFSIFLAGDLARSVTPEAFNSYYGWGYGIGGGIEYPVSPRWSFIGMIDYKTFSPSKGTIEGWWNDEGEYPDFVNIDPQEGGVTALTVSVLSKGTLRSEGSRVFPYVKGGFGLTIGSMSQIHMFYDNLNTDQRDSMWVSVEGESTNISIILGLGVEMKLGQGNASLFIDGGIQMIMLEDVNPTVAPINIGIKF